MMLHDFANLNFKVMLHTLYTERLQITFHIVVHYIIVYRTAVQSPRQLQLAKPRQAVMPWLDPQHCE